MATKKPRRAYRLSKALDLAMKMDDEAEATFVAVATITEPEITLVTKTSAESLVESAPVAVLPSAAVVVVVPEFREVEVQLPQVPVKVHELKAEGRKAGQAWHMGVG